jgi:UDP-N-acetylglucosamine 2-epimerase (non-hydrolysing)
MIETGSDRLRVLAVVGTRPEAIKMFSPVQAMRAKESAFEVLLCSSGQHSELLRDALDTFGLQVDEHFAAMRHDQHPAEVVWTIGRWISEVIWRHSPDVLLVQGDTATAMAAGLAGYYSSTRIAHVEAGLRTYDNRAPWPEEGSRRMLSAIADLHFAPTELAAANLVREGIAPESIHVTGNTGIDALHWALARPRVVRAHRRGERRVVVTCHRRESIPYGLEAIARAVRELALRYPEVRFQFVLHPSPSVQRAVRRWLNPKCPDNIELLRPCDYVSFVQMLAEAYVILTDSGGIQEEAPVLGRPVLVVNRRTERHEGVAAGTAAIVGTDDGEIVAAAAKLLEDRSHYAQMAKPHSAYGDGKAGERIAAVLARIDRSRGELRAPERDAALA